jgi:hypothetical protein
LGTPQWRCKELAATHTLQMLSNKDHQQQDGERQGLFNPPCQLLEVITLRCCCLLPGIGWCPPCCCCFCHLHPVLSTDGSSTSVVLALCDPRRQKRNWRALWSAGGRITTTTTRVPWKRRCNNPHLLWLPCTKYPDWNFGASIAAPAAAFRGFPQRPRQGFPAFFHLGILRPASDEASELK